MPEGCSDAPGSPWGTGCVGAGMHSRSPGKCYWIRSLLLGIRGEFCRGEEYLVFNFLYLALKCTIVAALDASFSDRLLACFGVFLIFPAVLLMDLIQKPQKWNLRRLTPHPSHSLMGWAGTQPVDPTCLFSTSNVEHAAWAGYVVVGQLMRFSPDAGC